MPMIKGQPNPGAVANRMRALAAYKANPSFCKHCTKLLLPIGKIAEVRRKQFCSHSCAASHNNLGHQHNKPKLRFCTVCDAKLIGGRRLYCSKLCCSLAKQDNMATTTKGELFSRHKTFHGARCLLQKHARIIAKRYNLARKCNVLGCKYEHHITLAHRKAVASFPATALISVINAPSNLMYLCPNHHWDYDHHFDLRLMAVIV